MLGPGAAAPALRGVKCGRPQCSACASMLEQAATITGKSSNKELAKLLNEVLLEVPLHSRKTAILVAIQTRLEKEEV